MRRLLLGGVFAAMIGVTGCGGGSSSSSSPATTTSVTISPTATQTVIPGGSVTYTAKVNSTNTTTGAVTDITSTGVTWEVGGTAGGSSSTGTITTAGVYTAPTVVNLGFSATITSVSVSDTSATASSQVNVITQPQITIAPTTATVAAGQTQTFIATTLVANQAVDWEVAGVVGGSAINGTITPTGVYTAPQVPPPGGQVQVTAVLDSDMTKTASATVADTFSTASLLNSYAFLIRGETTRGRFLRAGSFTADGQGNITAGIEDINGPGLPTPLAGGTSFTGTYNVGADGRGTMIFHDGFGSTFGAPGGNSKFTIIVVSPQQVQVAESDVFATGSGEADIQSSSPPSATAFSGAYVFDFSGTGATAEPLSIIGKFNAASNGAATGGGLDDVNDNGVLAQNASVTFSYQLGATGGRSTATLVDGSGTKNFGFYMLPTGRLRFIELDSATVVGGDAVAQSGSNFSARDLGSSLLATTTGTNASGPLATVASFSASGAGTLLPVTVVQNNAGTVTSQAATTNSVNTYAVAPNGRGTIALSTGQSYVFYLIASNQAVVQETDHVVASTVCDGLLVPLFNAPPDLKTWNANVAMQWTGAGISLGEQDATGQFVAAVAAPGGSQFKSGTLDSNTANGGGLPPSGFTPTSNVSLTPIAGPYQLSTTTGTINVTVGATNLQFAVYFTSPTSAIILRVDIGDQRALSGTIAKQF